MRIHFELTVEGPRLARPRRRRTLVALGALAMALLLPAGALASHLFSDVLTTHTFHTNISNLAGAGVTAGCGGGRYCPDEPVTRGQMAGFLNRGLGRVRHAEFTNEVTGSNDTVIGTGTITPGTATAGGTQFVRAQFNGTFELTNNTGCPCTVHVTLFHGATFVHDYEILVTEDTVHVYHPISAGGAIAVTGGAPVTISLHASIQPSADPATAYHIFGTLVLETIPFGSTGTSAP